MSLSLLFFTLKYDTFGGYCSTKLLQRFLSFFHSHNFRVPSQRQQDQGNRSGHGHSKESKISIKTLNINVLKALLFNYEPNIDYTSQSKHTFISLL